MVVEFMSPRNDVGPSTQLINVDENHRWSIQIEQAPACGTHQRFHQPGQNQGYIGI